MTPTRDFPITGGLGILAGSEREIAPWIEAIEARQIAGLGGVEIRADLLKSPEFALRLVERLCEAVPILFTARLKEQGGAYGGTETDRVRLYNDAVAAGAVLIDVEWGSDAAVELTKAGLPVIISQHDFGGMIDRSALAALTEEAATLGPRAIKVVPTATSPIDGVRMLEWVSEAPSDGPRRIGFAMGELGTFSRILSLAWGAPFTYASFGGAVAPGQVSFHDLTALYRAANITRESRVFGVIGQPVTHSLSPAMHNPPLAARSLDAVYLPLALSQFDDLPPLVDALGIDGVSVTIPFKSDAFRYARHSDERCRGSGAANTLIFESPESARAFNADVDGVLGPLARREIDLQGLSVGIIGNGGAARGAVHALREGNARPTIYYRRRERGEPVANELGVAARPLSELRAGDHRLLINATPLGLKPDDPSPVTSAVFDSDTVAFDMIYDPPQTPFLLASIAGGAADTISGREMLVHQGLIQFKLFTGKKPSYEELEAAFLAGQERRRKR